MGKKASKKKSKSPKAKKVATKKAIKKTAKKVAKKKVAKAVKKSVANKTVKKAKAASLPKRSAKAKSPLTKPELRKFRNNLLEKRRDLLGDMSGIEAEALKKGRQDISSDLSTLPTHPADIGTDNFEQEFTLGLLESERILLDKINAALQRIEDGAFGICLGTGEPIGKARLTARPWSRYCIEYAHLIEKGLVTPDDESSYAQADAPEDQQ